MRTDQSAVGDEEGGKREPSIEDGRENEALFTTPLPQRLQWDGAYYYRYWLLSTVSATGKHLHLSFCTRRHSSKIWVFMRGFHHKLTLYVLSRPTDENRGMRLSSHRFMLINAQMHFFLKTWDSCRWPGKAIADTWVYRRIWRCEPGMTWCWSVLPAHPNRRSTLGIRMWERFHNINLSTQLLPFLAFHLSPISFLKPHFSSQLSPFQTCSEEAFCV